jgi:predicted PurR-regulated permease PerM
MTSPAILNQRSVIALLATLGFLILAYLLMPILTPFITAFILAYISNPLVERLQKAGMSRSLAVSLVFALLALILLGLLLVMIPAIQKQLLKLVHKLPVYADTLQFTLLPWLELKFGLDFSALDLTAMRKTLLAHWQDVGGWMGRFVASVSQSGLQIFGVLANLVLLPLITFYLMRDWHGLLARINNLIAPAFRARVQLFASESDQVLGAFLKGQLLVMLALAVTYSIGLSLIGLDLAILLGMIAGLVSFVPYLGFIVGVVLAGVAAILQFHEYSILLSVIIIFGVGQLLESFLLTPYLVGDRLGLHPVAVIFAIMAGGELFGFVGILVALPVAAVLVVGLRQLGQLYDDGHGASGSGTGVSRKNKKKKSKSNKKKAKKLTGRKSASVPARS